MKQRDRIIGIVKEPDIILKVVGNVMREGSHIHGM